MAPRSVASWSVPGDHRAHRDWEERWSVGLDTFAAPSPGKKLTRVDRRAFEKAKIELSGGMYSGDPGSFRGKIYVYLVHHLTGVSLYQDWIPPQTVARMSRSLDSCDPEAALRTYDGPYEEELTPKDVINLRTFFRVCAKRKLGLVGWW
jgi:hypothetical protein